jgi:hypothetical protein
MSGSSGSHDGPQRQERRRTPRHLLGAVRQVAEIHNGRQPSADAFQRVQIVDVSCDGFAYLTLSIPESEEVLVIMGDQRELSCLRARVVYSKVLEQWGRQIVRVGCQFTGDAQVDAISLVRAEETKDHRLLPELAALMPLLE